MPGCWRSPTHGSERTSNMYQPIRRSIGRTPGFFIGARRTSGYPRSSLPRPGCPMNNLFDVLGGIVLTMAASLLVAVLFPVGLAYIALRVRDNRAKVPDPKLGL